MFANIDDIRVAERLSVVVEICFFLPFLLSPKKRLSAGSPANPFLENLVSIKDNIYLL